MKRPRPAPAPTLPLRRVSAPGRRERRQTETRERLFRAALRLFAEQGFSETTVEDITNAADVGKGTFFNYFPSKDHILIAFSDMQLGKLRALVDDAQHLTGTMPQFLKTMSLRLTEEPGRNPHIVRTLIWAALSGEPVREAMRLNQAEAHALLTRLIEIGQQRREIRSDIPASKVARTFRQMVFGTMLMWTLTPEVPFQQRIDSALELLWKGMAAPAVPAQPDAQE